MLFEEFAVVFDGVGFVSGCFEGCRFDDGVGGDRDGV